MGKRTFKIDDKNPLYKKLIKLPDTYYKLENSGDGYIIHSHDGSASKVKNPQDVRLKWESDKIVLKIKKEDGGEKDYIIEQEAIMDGNRDDTISKLQTTGKINIAIKEFKSVSEDSKNYCIALYPPGSRQMTGVLNFINFNDKNDPVLQKIKGKGGRLYFTIEEDDNIYISDKDGNCLEVCPDGKCYKYQYTKDKRDALEISEISTVLESLTKAEQCGVSEATESSTKAEQGFTLQKGKELSDDIYEAKIMSSGRLIATLPKIGYHMLSGELVIYDHITKEKVKIPRDFHYLKVVKSSNNDDYELTFCNFLGNEFFEYKKYDPQYSNVPDEYRYISLNCIKKEYKPNFCKLLNCQPSFFIAEGTTNPNSLSHCPADVFELTQSGKGKKMATLIDQFGSFNKNGKFQYCDYHTKIEYDIYDSYKINKEYIAADANNEFCFNDDVILYAIPELL